MSMASRAVRPPGAKPLAFEEYLSVTQLSERVPYKPKTIRNLMCRGRCPLHPPHRSADLPLVEGGGVAPRRNAWPQRSESIDAPIASFLTSTSGAVGSA